MSSSVPPLISFLAEIPDFRKAHGKRYALLALLLYVCVAILCGRRSQAAIADWGKDYGQPWLAQLGLRGWSPSQPTIHRLFKGIRREQVEHALCRWALGVLRHLAPGEELEAIAIDGKTLRGSAQQGAEELHLLGALSQRLNIVLGQVAVPDATNEMGMLDQLLDLIGIAGYVTTTDALHTQRDIAQAIVAEQGDYLQVVKENQPGLLEDIMTLFEPPPAVQATFHEAHSTNLHGDRIEERHLLLPWLSWATPIGPACTWG